MNNHINNALFIFCIAILFSCTERKDSVPQNSENKSGPQEIPEALKDDTKEISISRNRYSNDLTEELYAELVGKRPELKSLEEDLEHLRSKSGEVNQNFNQYDDKSSSYYRSADSKAGGISDTLLRKRITNLIANSKNQYAGKTSELNSLLNQISQKESTIADHHAVLKIVLTLPLIEAYQKNNLPDKKIFKDLIKKEENFIHCLDSLTPKY